MAPQPSAQMLRMGTPSALEIEAASAQASSDQGRCCGWLPTGMTVDRAQGVNQRGWTGHFIRWMPLLGVMLGCVGVYFGIRNFRLIFAQRTYSLVKQTGPVLADAHNHILEGLAKIQQHLGIANVSTAEPPLPPEPMVRPGR